MRDVASHNYLISHTLYVYSSSPVPKDSRMSREIAAVPYYISAMTTNRADDRMEIYISVPKNLLYNELNCPKVNTYNMDSPPLVTKCTIWQEFVAVCTFISLMGSPLI